jgi:hypothetical protein
MGPSLLLRLLDVVQLLRMNGDLKEWQLPSEDSVYPDLHLRTVRTAQLTQSASRPSLFWDVTRHMLVVGF